MLHDCINKSQISNKFEQCSICIGFQGCYAALQSLVSWHIFNITLLSVCSPLWQIREIPFYSPILEMYIISVSALPQCNSSFSLSSSSFLAFLPNLWMLWLLWCSARSVMRYMLCDLAFNLTRNFLKFIIMLLVLVFNHLINYWVILQLFLKMFDHKKTST